MKLLGFSKWRPFVVVGFTFVSAPLVRPNMHDWNDYWQDDIFENDNVMAFYLVEGCPCNNQKYFNTVNTRWRRPAPRHEK